jgi:hypothetical protein
MKKIIVMLSLLALLTGCSDKPDDSTTKFLKSDKQEWRQVPTGKLNKFGNPEMTTEYFYQEWAEIKPTWGQAFLFASKAGHTPLLIIGVLLIATIPWILIKSSRDEPVFKIGKWKFDPGSNIKHGGRNVALTCFLFLVSGAMLIYIQPGNVKFRNNKPIDKAHYEKVISIHGDSKPLWDSLLLGGHIIGGPGKK